jgi:hypothetical protein
MQRVSSVSDEKSSPPESHMVSADPNTETPGGFRFSRRTDVTNAADKLWA